MCGKTTRKAIFPNKTGAFYEALLSLLDFWSLHPRHTKAKKTPSKS